MKKNVMSPIYFLFGSLEQYADLFSFSVSYIKYNIFSKFILFFAFYSIGEVQRVDSMKNNRQQVVYMHNISFNNTSLNRMIKHRH